MSVPELKQASNGVWYIHWTEPGKPGERGRSKRQSTGTKELAAAKTYLGQWLLMERAQPTEKTFTVAELWALYWKQHVEKNVVGQETLEYNWKNLKPHFGDLMVPAVTEAVVDAYVAKRQKGVIGRPSQLATVRRELIGLRACFNWAARPKQKLITAEQIPAFDLPPDSDPRDRWLREDEIRKLLDKAAAMRRGERLSRGERFLWLALETAARKEAIWQLTWDRVDFETGVIHYDVPGRKKTKKRRASVPISKALRPVLERAFTERINSHVLDNEAEVWKIVRRIADNAGVDGVSPHVLRHTAATHMARRGVPLWKIAGVLGNSMKMIEETYAKHCPEGLAEAVEKITGEGAAPAGDELAALLAALKSGKFKLVEVTE